MTKKEIKQSHLSLMEDGTLALTLDREDGSVNVLRTFSSDEITNLLMLSFLSHLHQNPKQPIQVIALNETQSLVTTIIDNDAMKKENKE